MEGEVRPQVGGEALHDEDGAALRVGEPNLASEALVAPGDGGLQQAREAAGQRVVEGGSPGTPGQPPAPRTDADANKEPEDG